MAMIEIGLGEFIDSLMAKKTQREGPIEEGRRAQVKQELLILADKAVDVAIMRAVMRSAYEGLITKRAVDKVYDLMQGGSKPETYKYLEKIIEVDQEIADELVRFEAMYLSGSSWPPTRTKLPRPEER